MEKTDVIILCGGKSRRMGTDKAKLSMLGETFLQRIAGNFSEEYEVFLAIGMKAEYEGIHVKQVRDIYQECGPLAGIHAVMRESAAELFFVVTCDMPFADSSLVKALYRYMRKDSTVDAVVPVDRNGRKHVLGALYRRRIYDSVEKALKDRNYRVKSVLENLNVKYIDFLSLNVSERQIMNINTPEEYHKLCKLNAGNGTKKCLTDDVTENGIPVFSLVGYSGTGKTTFIEKLIPELKKCGVRVAAIKHDAHEFEIDREGKDSWRITQAGADVTGLISSTRAVLMENRYRDISDFLDGITDVDIILTEGCKYGRWPKIMLYRSAVGKSLPLNPSECLAVVSDVEIAGALRQYGLDDAAGVAKLILEVVGQR